MNTFKHQENHEFEENIRTAKLEIIALLEGERKPQHATHLQAATYIASRSQSASEAAKGAEPLNRKERANYNQQVKPVEEKELITWALKNKLWVPELEFNKTFAQDYVDAGAEQKVYLKKDGRKVCKVNTGSFHGTWLDFFIRLIIHQAIFPSTAYTLEGFTEEEKHFCAIIEQPWVTVERGASKGEVEALLLQIGFVNTRHNDYYNKEQGLILEDLHDENVFIGLNGNLLFVDPVLYLETPDLGLGGRSQFCFPFKPYFQ